MKAIGFVVLAYGMISIASILFIGMLLMTFWVKYKRSHMNEEKWDVYFKTMSNAGYVIRFSLIYCIPMIMVSCAGYHIYEFFGYEQTKILAFATFVFGILKVIYEIMFHKQELLEKCKKFW